MSGLNDVLYLDALEQAELIRSGRIKATELVEAAVRRIEQVNPVINAVVADMFDAALKAAENISTDAVFAGVPMVLKDLMAAYAGMPLTMGSRLYKEFIPPVDSELVVRYKKAGLIPVAKTNTSEFGLLPTAEPELFGPCRNPWNPELTSGGSSGGSAAAVASGVCAIGHGNDGGGSIRIPASCCGVFGLKPTRARNPMGPIAGDFMSGLPAEHAITRSVRDSAALLDATSGPDLGDPYWAPPNERPFLEEVNTDPGRLRIAFAEKPLRDLPVHEDCVKAVRDAAKLCEEAGHIVEETSPTVDGDSLVNVFMVMWGAGCAMNIDMFKAFTGRDVTPDMVEPLTWAVYEKGRKVTASNYLMAVMEMHRLSRDVARFFVDYDVWLTPTVAEPPTPIGAFDDPVKGMKRSGGFAAFTGVCNLTGQPAMSIPLYWNDSEVPIGVQFVGRFGDEATLFRLAGQLEKARPWAHRRPPI